MNKKCFFNMVSFLFVVFVLSIYAYSLSFYVS